MAYSIISIVNMRTATAMQVLPLTKSPSICPTRISKQLGTVRLELDYSLGSTQGLDYQPILVPAAHLLDCISGTAPMSAVIADKVLYAVSGVAGFCNCTTFNPPLPDNV